jgi:hypothetical protein
MVCVHTFLQDSGLDVWLRGIYRDVREASQDKKKAISTGIQSSRHLPRWVPT